MNRPCDQFLPSARFSLDKNAGIRGRHLVDCAQHITKRLRRADDLFIDRTLNNLILEQTILGLELFFERRDLLVCKGVRDGDRDNFQNILKFPDRYPGVTIYKIEKNYRSTPEILEVANAAIRANVKQFSKKLAPVRQAGLVLAFPAAALSREAPSP